jgi:hypothetical protein
MLNNNVIALGAVSATALSFCNGRGLSIASTPNSGSFLGCQCFSSFVGATCTDLGCECRACAGILQFCHISSPLVGCLGVSKSTCSHWPSKIPRAPFLPRTTVQIPKCKVSQITPTSTQSGSALGASTPPTRTALFSVRGNRCFDSVQHVVGNCYLVVELPPQAMQSPWRPNVGFRF